MFAKFAAPAAATLVVCLMLAACAQAPGRYASAADHTTTNQQLAKWNAPINAMQP
jgi:hypothetical protein